MNRKFGPSINSRAPSAFDFCSTPLRFSLSLSYYFLSLISLSASVSCLSLMSLSLSHVSLFRLPVPRRWPVLSMSSSVSSMSGTFVSCSPSELQSTQSWLARSDQTHTHTHTHRHAHTKNTLVLYVCLIHCTLYSTLLV